MLSAVMAFGTLGVAGEFPALKAQALGSRTLTIRSSEGTETEMAQYVAQAGEALNEIAAERDIMAVVYLSDEYPVRQEPSYDSQAAVTVCSGQTVNILDVYVDENFDFEIVCPYCNYEFVSDFSQNLKEQVECPECHNIIELDWNNHEEHDCSGHCSCCESECGQEEEEDEEPEQETSKELKIEIANYDEESPLEEETDMEEVEDDDEDDM